VKRFLSFLVGNWPLKLGAVVLATVLYGGVVISENVRTWSGQVPIEVRNPPANAAVLDVLGNVTGIRYRAPIDVAAQLTNGSFQASVDLSNLAPQPDAAPVEVAVNVFAIDRRVQIIDFNPPAVRVRIDSLEKTTRPVSVDYGIVPEGFRIGQPQVTPNTVTVTGASTRVANVKSITARVTIDASGISVNQDAALVALDALSNEVPGIKLDPARVHVSISVARDLATATVPVVPKLTGAPAPGYQMSAIVADPLAVGVSGEADTVARLTSVETAAIDMTDRTASFATDVALLPAAGITLNGPATAHVSVTIEPTPGSRTYEVGLQVIGARGDLLYDLSLPSVLVTLSGPTPTLDALSAEDLHATLAVGAYDVGSHLVQVVPDVPTGLTVLSVAPTSVDVVARLAPRASPSPSDVPSPSPVITPVP
jgi:YbbR domain-containing protein